MTNDNIQRQPNPPGWIPPRAPYNPYDYTDVRPPMGYPSEFKPPGKESTAFSEIPRDASQYAILRQNMKKLSYTPRPISELYPGKYKVLKRLHTTKNFENGVKFSSKLLIFGVITYTVFFSRWNDGYENIFSKFYRFQLSMRSKLFDIELTPEQELDLAMVKEIKFGNRSINSSNNRVNTEQVELIEENNKALQRPTKRQYMEAERLTQELELKELRKGP